MTGRNEEGNNKKPGEEEAPSGLGVINFGLMYDGNGSAMRVERQRVSNSLMPQPLPAPLSCPIHSDTA